MRMVTVKPRDGARIRQPDRNGRVMAAEGAIVNADNPYYLNALRTGDLVEAKPTKPERTKPPKGDDA